MNVFPVIMAGGKGERFWPYSNHKHPKQLLKLVTDHTMLEDILGLVDGLEISNPVHIIASQHIEKPIQTLLKENSIINKKIILVGEPESKNTAVAIALASRLIHQRDPQGVMVVLTADHHIKPKEEFIRSIKVATELAREGTSLVTFGITPTRPDTNYGYIEANISSKKNKDLDYYSVERFHEKPNESKAKDYANSKNFFWNSGMFAWRVDYLWSLFKDFLPQIYIPFENANLSSPLHKEFTEQLQNLYPQLPSESIDYGIMEKAPIIKVVIPNYAWDDMGSWLALKRLHPKDSNNNVNLGNNVQLDTKNSLIFSDDGLVATYGIDNLIVIQHNGITLVIHKNKITDIKKILEEVKKKSSLKQFL